MKDTLQSLQTARQRIRIKILPNLTILFGAKTSSSATVNKSSAGDVKKLKLLAELEQLTDNLKQTRHKLVKLIEFVEKHCRVNCNLRELIWSRDMLTNKINKQIATVRIMLLTTQGD